MTPDHSRGQADIVERLRMLKRISDAEPSLGLVICCEAADEIERLRDTLLGLHNQAMANGDLTTVAMTRRALEGK